MSSVVAIRTNRWTSEEERLVANLQQAKGEDVVVVFHNRPEGVEPPVPVIDLNDQVCEAMGLGLPHDWGWRCGDYFYYALRAARPDYEFYWLVEPDVMFTGDPSSFFAAFEGDERDLLGVSPGPFENKAHPFLSTLQHLEPYRAIFALTRFSGRALDRLLPQRQASAKVPKLVRKFANDEFFTFSTVQADPELSIGDLVEGAPSWFDGAYVESDPDLLIDLVRDDESLRNKVFHPVKTKEFWMTSVAHRLSNKTAFLKHMVPSLKKLSDEEIEAMAQMAHDNVLAALKKARG